MFRDIATYSKIYFIEKYKENHTVLFVVNFDEKKIYCLDPKMDRNNISEDFTAYLTTMKEKINHFTSRSLFNSSDFSVDKYPDQYYQRDESDLDCQVQVLTCIYFIEREVPIWYNNSILMNMKIKFCSWALKGTLPF